MRQKLATVPHIANKIIPTDFDVGCRRPTPAPGYLETLSNPKVTVFTDELREMTEKGFIDAEGVEHEVDVFICVSGIFPVGLRPMMFLRLRVSTRRGNPTSLSFLGARISRIAGQWNLTRISHMLFPTIPIFSSLQVPLVLLVMDLPCLSLKS